ncbi:phage tail protein I [Psychrobacter lutiphocae]|uniref:phage tail protein I n=1 Tax=Psychrobacter lutiphocae TaxID=540500 RepID=UPI00035D8191|nr:phage tail protein I [Psychrobacter lutiphocae]
MAEVVQDSVLPMVLQNHRFLVLESLLERLNSLPQYAVIMLIDIVPSDSLPWFADHFSLFGDGWTFATTEQEQRDLIKSAIEIHRHKGTPWAIKRTLSLLGYFGCEIEERFAGIIHNASFAHDGQEVYGTTGAWTHYKLYIPYLITQLEANRIRNLLADVAPLRCLLISIDMQLTYDNSIIHDATYHHQGVISWQAN